MFWNVKGATLLVFYRFFGSLIKNYKPVMVVLLEPGISGYKADDFIKRISFDKSPRVEATGFSEGIWIL